MTAKEEEERERREKDGTGAGGGGVRGDTKRTADVKERGGRGAADLNLMMGCCLFVYYRVSVCVCELLVSTPSLSAVRLLLVFYDLRPQFWFPVMHHVFLHTCWIFECPAGALDPQRRTFLYVNIEGVTLREQISDQADDSVEL